jgi:hypothetical protein
LASKQQTANSKQQTADSKRQTANSRQVTAEGNTNGSAVCCLLFAVYFTHD